MKTRVFIVGLVFCVSAGVATVYRDAHTFTLGTDAETPIQMATGGVVITGNNEDSSSALEGAAPAESGQVLGAYTVTAPRFIESITKTVAGQTKNPLTLQELFSKKHFVYADVLGVGSDYVASLTGKGLQIVGGKLTCAPAGDNTYGCINGNTLDRLSGKVSGTDISSSASLRSLIQDETGTGNIVFNTNPSLSGVVLTDIGTSTLLATDGSGKVVGTTTPTLAGLVVTGAATSIFASGIDLTTGCFSINGTCLGGGGVLSINGQGGAVVQTFASTASGTDFSIATSSNTFTFNLPSASASNRGLLLSSDWNTFNAKQSAITPGSLLSFSGATLNSTALASSSLASSSALSVLLSDETGTGSLVFSVSPTFTGTANFANASTTIATIRKLFDATGSAGQNGYVLQSNGSTTQWVATSSLGFGAGGVTSVNGQSGVITQTFSSTTSGTDFSITTAGNAFTFNLPSSSASNRGLLMATDWSAFNNKQNAITPGNLLSFSGATLNSTALSTSSLDTSAKLAAILTDETGSAGGGLAVFSNAPAFSGTATFAALTATGTLTVANNINISDIAKGYQLGGNRILYASSTNFSTLVGIGAGNLLDTTGLYNTALGYQSLYTATSSTYNTAVGYQSLYSNTTGSSNTANGVYSLSSNTTGSNNTANGFASLYLNTTGINNTANGTYALYANTTGINNTANGTYALFANTTGSSNTAIGLQALYTATSSSYNTALGQQSLFLNRTGANNTASGYGSLYNNTTGSSNTASGYASLYFNTTGINNTALGYASLYSNTTGSYNTAIGLQSGYDIDTATSTGANTIIGYNTGRGITTGINNTILGANVTGLAAGLSNNIIIADGAGNQRINVDSTGNVGIGTTTPTRNLQVYQDQNGGTKLSATNPNLGTAAFSQISADASGGGLYMYALGSGYTSSGQYKASGGTLEAAGIGGLGLSAQQDNLYFYTNNGAERMRITTAGNVGIGTSTPNWQLQVASPSGTPYIALSNMTGGVDKKHWLLSNSGDGIFRIGTSSDALTSTSTKLLVDATRNNFFVGRQSGTSTGSSNNALGYQSLLSNTSGSHNNALGYQTLYSNTTGNANNVFGQYSLYSNTTGSYNNALGYSSLYSNTTGQFNNAFGYLALQGSSTAFQTGSHNNALGYASLFYNTSGSYNNALGYGSLYSNTTGQYNNALGYQSLNLNTAGTNNNALGFQSLYNSSTGTDNNALGSSALYNNTTGSYNNALGNAALYFNTTGQLNNAFGYGALQGSSTAFQTGSYNNALGFQSLYNNASGGSNNALGYQSLLNNTTGSYNNAFGQQALTSNTTGSNNNALGLFSLVNNTTGGSNTAFGYLSLAANTTGSFNNALGNAALSNNTTGLYNNALGFGALQGSSTAFQTGLSNNAFGYQTLFYNTTGSYNNALGQTTLFNNTTGGNNNALGNSALFYNTTGSNNNAFGVQALQGSSTAFMTGSHNNAIGYQSLYRNATGNNNNALGIAALFNNTSGSQNNALGNNALVNNTSGSNNNALGFQSLYNNSTGTDNNALGFASLFYNTTGTQNNALGNSALGNNTTGNYNNAFGIQALQGSSTAFQTGSSNNAFGYQTLLYNSTGGYNNAFGQQALTSNSTGSYNNALGAQSLFYNTTGTYNNAIGQAALYLNTTGGNNNYFGVNAGYDNTTGSQNIGIGSFPTIGVGITTGSNNILLGNDVRPQSRTASNQLNIGNLIYSQGLGGGSTLAAGNVGIGTSTPNTLLSISNTGGSAAYSSWGLASSAYAASDVLVANSVGPGYQFAQAKLQVQRAGNLGQGWNFLVADNAGGATSEAVRITSEGLVGIGTSSPAWKLQVASAALAGADNAGAFAVTDSANPLKKLYFGYDTTVDAGFIQSVFTGTAFKNLSLNPNGGIVVIGTTTPLVDSNIPVQIGAQVGGVTYFGANKSGSYGALYGYRNANSGYTGGEIRMINNEPFRILTNDNERMRIDAAGNVGIGTTSPLNRLTVQGSVSGATSSIANYLAQLRNNAGVTTGNGLAIVAGTTTGSGAAFLGFYTPDGSYIGGIRQSSGSGVAYDTASDERIKENIGTTSHSLADLLRVGVFDFSFKSDTSHQMQTGFIAQNIYAVFPDAVATNGDNGSTTLAAGAVPWAVDYGRITPLIVKSLQEVATLSGVFKDNLIAWLGSAENGITRLVSKEIIVDNLAAHQVTTNTLCVNKADGSPVCITGNELSAMLSQSAVAPATGTTTPGTFGGGGGAGATSTTGTTGTTTSPDTSGASSTPLVNPPPATPPNVPPATPPAPDTSTGTTTGN